MKPIATYTSSKELSKLMVNAKRLRNEEVYNKAFVRRCELEGIDVSDPLHRDFHQAIAAYELILEEKHGRRVPASRTRQKLKNKGVEQCLIDWALGSQETAGFRALMERGLVQLTAERVVVKHSGRFAAHVVAAAKRRLEGIERG